MAKVETVSCVSGCVDKQIHPHHRRQLVLQMYNTNSLWYERSLRNMRKRPDAIMVTLLWSAQNRQLCRQTVARLGRRGMGCRAWCLVMVMSRNVQKFQQISSSLNVWFLFLIICKYVSLGLCIYAKYPLFTPRPRVNWIFWTWVTVRYELPK